MARTTCILSMLYIAPKLSSLSFIFYIKHPTPVLLPGKSNGRWSLVGCSSWGREESDTTERLHFHFHRAAYIHIVPFKYKMKEVNKRDNIGQ